MERQQQLVCYQASQLLPALHHQCFQHPHSAAAAWTALLLL
jgi:hypothetical protein